MSGANDVAGDITLEELSRLIRILGMLGSGSDGEALAAAKFAVKWVREHQTTWEALLTPEPAALVTGVAVGAVAPATTAELQEAAVIVAREAGYRLGLQAGIAQGAQEAAKAFKAQAAAQAAMASAGTAQSPLHAHYANYLHSTAPQKPVHGAGATVPPWARAKAQGPVRAPGTSPGAPAGGYQAGSWQAVAQELLDRHAQGIPGVFRGLKEEQFVGDVLARRFASLTPGQETWLRDIAGRSGMSW